MRLASTVFWACIAGIKFSRKTRKDNKVRKPPDKRLSAWRIRRGRFGSDDSLGNTGAFIVPVQSGLKLQVISSGTDEVNKWEHVSVSTYRKNRTPTWDEMVYIKNIFWDPEETVIQYHPPRSQYVNNHPHVLHMWRPLYFEIPLPPLSTVGIKGARVLGTDGQRLYFTMSD